MWVGGSAEPAPGAGGLGPRSVRVPARAFEADWARNLVANKPRRGQTVLKVAGAYAIANSVTSVALARPAMQRGRGQDLVFVPMWCDSEWSDGGGGDSGGGGGGRSGGGAHEAEDGGSGVLVEQEGGGVAGSLHRAGAQALPGMRPKLRLAVMRCREGDPLALLVGGAGHEAGGASASQQQSPS